MNLLRIHAYSVQPSRHQEQMLVEGGELARKPDVRTALEETAGAFDTDGVPIAFVVDPATRTNDVRELCRELVFTQPAKALAASRRLAERLAGSLDQRSHPCLFVMATYGDRDKRRLHMWTFPKDEVFRFEVGRQPTIELLSDIFSRTSKMGKGVRFEGHDDEVGFVEGQAIDYQVTYIARPLADLWIVTFLKAQLSVQSDSGTRLLAACIRTTVDRAADPEDRNQLYKAAIAIRASQQRRWSLKQVASTYLPEGLRERFLQSAPSEQARTALFQVNHEQFEELVGTRVFQLDTGVMVSAPFEAVGHSVRLEGNQHNLLKVEGRVVKERMKKRARRPRGGD